MKKEFIRIWTFIALLLTRNAVFRSNFSLQFSLSLGLLGGVPISLSSVRIINLFDQPQITLALTKSHLLRFKTEKILGQARNFE